MKQVTIESLMQTNTFKEELTLAAGAKGLGRTVASVTVHEAPDCADWLEGEEFVLSTWYVFAHDKDRGISAFKKMADSIAALAIKIPRFIQEIPQEILDLANQRGVPVFSVRHGAKFRDIIKSISAAINNYQSSVLYEIRDYYNQLSQIVHNNGNEKNMLEALAKRIELPCFIVETSLRQSLCSGGQAQSLNEEVLTVLCSYMKDKTDFPSTDFRIDNLHIFPCSSHNACYCYVVLLSEAPLSEKMLFMCDQLCTVLTIKRQERAEIRQKGIERLYFNFILNNTMPVHLAEQEFKKMGLDTTGDFQAAILFSKATEDSSKFLGFRFFAADLGHFICSSVNRMEADRMIFLFGHGEKGSTQPLQQNVSRLLPKYPNQRFFLGPRVNELRQLPMSYRFASQCTLLASDEKQLVCYSEYSHWLAVLAGHSGNEAQWFIKQYMFPLEEYENGKSNLLETLGTALFWNDTEIAAQKIGIHANSIRYRMKKIKELIGLDFFLPYDRSILFVAYLMYKGRQNLLEEKK